MPSRETPESKAKKLQRAGRALRAARETLGHDQSRAAKRLAVSQSRMSTLETGKFRPGLVLAQRIAAEYGLALDVWI